MSGPSGNQLVLFSLESDVSLDFTSGKHYDSQENRVHKIRQIWRILRQNCSDDSTRITEGVTSTPEIFGKNTVLSLPFLQQIQLTLIVNIVNLNKLNHQN